VGTWTVAGWTAVVLGAPAALYGLHRLALGMEARGYIYYLNKKPAGGGGAAGAFGALQQILEPRSVQVVQVRDASVRLRQDDSGGPAGEPPRSPPGAAPDEPDRL
jgi:hypothetical protein